MCTVTWSIRPTGTAVCFTRDERHSRAEALAPRPWPGGFLAPQDADGGGTWFAVTLDGTVLALLNHYAAAVGPAARGPRSRGLLIPALAAGDCIAESRSLRRWGLAELAPFRLLELRPAEATARLGVWDGTRWTERRIRPPQCGMITSSSWKTARVTLARSSAFRQLLKQQPAPDLSDLIHFHSTPRDPRGPAWDIFMHRPDARSVSLNTLTMTAAEARMTHQSRAPLATAWQPAPPPITIALSPCKVKSEN